MKKLTKEEAVKIIFENGVKGGCKKDSKNKEVIKIIDLLELGESLLISPEDWHTKTKPPCLLAQMYRKERSSKKMSIKTLTNNLGWVVTRVR